MSSNRWYSSPTQVFWVCNELLKGRTLTHKTEIREVKGWRLASIVHRLKTRYDWPIRTEFRGAENLAHYTLRPGTTAKDLTFPASAKELAEGGTY